MGERSQRTWVWKFRCVRSSVLPASVPIASFSLFVAELTVASMCIEGLKEGTFSTMESRRSPYVFDLPCQPGIARHGQVPDGNHPRCRGICVKSPPRRLKQLPFRFWHIAQEAVSALDSNYSASSAILEPQIRGIGTATIRGMSADRAESFEARYVVEPSTSGNAL